MVYDYEWTKTPNTVFPVYGLNTQCKGSCAVSLLFFSLKPFVSRVKNCTRIPKCEIKCGMILIKMKKETGLENANEVLFA